jgi:hypothetical protein
MGIACYRYNILIFAKIKFERHEISVSQIQNLKSKIQNWTMGIACYRYNILIFAKIKFERHEISVSQIQNLKSKIQNWTTLSSTN